MSRLALAVFCIGMLTLVVPARAAQQSDVTRNVGAKMWLVSGSWTPQGGGSERSGDGVLWGPIVALDLPKELWISGMWLQGALDYEDRSVDQQDVELVIGRTFPLLEVGAGARYWYKSWLDQSATSYGPLVYASTGRPFGESVVAWYAGLTWMFAELEGGTGNTGEHYNLECGLYGVFEDITATVGFRYKNYYGSSIDLIYQGVTASVSYGF